VDKIIKKIKVETGMEKLPEGMLALSKFSFDLFMEHLKEKSELLSPYMIDPKLIYLIAYAVSVSIHSDECATTYLRQSMKSGAKIEEIEDALSISRFITGNKAYITSVEVLQEMATKVEV
jgi:alkylhydroperoxidase/carboxymuconolactone decarboxylase family protein YurZ